MQIVESQIEKDMLTEEQAGHYRRSRKKMENVISDWTKYSSFIKAKLGRRG